MADSRADSRNLDSISQGFVNLKGDSIISPKVISSFKPASAVSLRPLLDHSMISVSLPIQPIESKSIDNFKMGKPLLRTTFHPVFKAIEKNETAMLPVFFKENPPESYLSELEAVNAGYYKFIAPDYIPDTRAVYEEKSGILAFKGVVSEEIFGFQPSSVDPLKEEDLDVAHLAKHNLFLVLDNIEKEIRVLEKSSIEIERKTQKLDEEERSFHDRLKHLAELDSASSIAEIDEISHKFQLNSQSKNNQFVDSCKITKKLYDLYTKMFVEHNVSKVEFEKYRIVKGAAIGLTVSYIFMEDDLHQNNMTKDGKRIDFDMSLWPILFDFKKNGVIDVAFRKPSITAYDVTKYDIVHFPHIKDIVPFYWPTNSPHILSESTTALLKNFVPVSTNPYSLQINSIYHKLEKNPVFVYHKFSTMLKYILSNADTYRYIAQLHMRKECVFQSKPVIEILAQCQASRIQKFKDQLVKIPFFAEFMTRHGKVVFKEIMATFVARNHLYEQKVLQIERDLEELHARSENLSEMNASLLRKSTDISPEMPTHSFEFSAPLEIVDNYAHVVSAEEEKLLRQKKDERKLQLDMFVKIESDLKRVAIDIHQKESAHEIYSRQQIDIEYVASTYENICGHLESITRIEEEEEPIASVKSGNDQAVVPAAVLPAQTNTKYHFFDFSFLSKSQPSVPPIKLNDYQCVKEKVVQAMQLYIYPQSIFALNGLFRTQVGLAQKTIDFCESLNPDPANIDANIDAINKVKTNLEEAKSKLSTGGMFTALNDLLKDEIWKTTADTFALK